MVPTSDAELVAEVARVAAGALTLDAVLRAVAEGLVRAGLEPGRVNLAVLTVHPALAGIGFAWSRATANVASQSRPWGFLDQQEHLESPLHAVMTSRRPLRLRLAAGEGTDTFPIVSGFREQGATDYVAVPVSTIRSDTHVLSSWTDRPGGWDDAQIATICALAPVLSLAIESSEWRRLSQTIVETYLGRRTGPKVLAGRIHRGESERIRAAVWFCDVRSFTDLTRRFGDEAMVTAMDGWFEIVVDAVHGHDGEVLKFMGDALLAIFPVQGDDWASAVESALAAAVELHAAERCRAEATKVPIFSGVGLHTGEVIYGNVGAPGRLDFTVIGTAVNTAARIAALCRPLEEPTVVSRRVAETSPRDFRSRGSHVLRGLVEPMDVFAPTDGPSFVISGP
jgi:adenylate cyclase